MSTTKIIQMTESLLGVRTFSDVLLQVVVLLSVQAMLQIVHLLQGGNLCSQVPLPVQATSSGLHKAINHRKEKASSINQLHA